MTEHRVVSRDEWLQARIELLAREKEHSRQRDALSKARRDLPWEKIDKPYVFVGPDGEESLGDLFDGRSQLIVYHFMFDPEWDAGCKSCSYLTDHFQGAVVHLAQRDVTLVAASRAPLEKLLAFKKRMGWTHKWVSSHGSDFNYDFGVSFTPEEWEAGTGTYNYRQAKFPAKEAPGLSVFSKEGEDVFHTYSTYARGLDELIGSYNYLDLVPKGRDEGDLEYSMAWLRLRDEY